MLQDAFQLLQEVNRRICSLSNEYLEPSTKAALIVLFVNTYNDSLEFLRQSFEMVASSIIASKKIKDSSKDFIDLLGMYHRNVLAPVGTVNGALT